MMRGWMVVVALAACGPKVGGGAGGGGAVAIDPGACGKIDTNPTGRKLYAFLVASAELDQTSRDLENTVAGACRRMARDLGVSPEGTTKEVCTRASQELQANLKISVKTEKQLVTKTTPPVCHTDVDLTASFVAQCEADASVNASVTCQGRCGGTCSGACDGTCSSGTAAQCNGQCSGTCRGRCTGGCEGYADVNASAECKASAEVHATTHTTCTPAKVEVVQQDVTIVDASKFQRAQAAIADGLPDILLAAKRLELASRAVAQWASSGAQLLEASGQLADQIGDKGLCVGEQIAAVVAASTQIQARFSVSIEVSAQVSASAGAQ